MTGAAGPVVGVCLPDGRLVTVGPDGTVTVTGPADGPGYSLTLPTVQNVAWRWRLADCRAGGVPVRVHYAGRPEGAAARCA